jgi:5'-3' exoribonuclease 1
MKLGYSRRGESGWEFSQKAVELLQQYMIKFPDFIAGIQRNPQSGFYGFEPFLNLLHLEGGNFLRIEISRRIAVTLRPLDAEQLDSDIVMLIEHDADILNASQPDMQPKKVRGVPRSALLRPADGVAIGTLPESWA